MVFFFFLVDSVLKVQPSNLAAEEMSLWGPPGRTRPAPTAAAASPGAPEDNCLSEGRTRMGVLSGVCISKTKRLGRYNQRPNNTGE